MEFKFSLKEEDLNLVVEKLIEIISSNNKELKATVVALSGLLGSGKTTFTKCLAKKLEIKDHITSPTFLLIKKYEIPNKNLGFENFVHIDAYRLNSSKEIESLDIENILTNPKNLVVIEWAKKIKEIIPKNSIWINFSHQKESIRRSIEIKTY